MFIGHFGLSLAAKKAAPGVSLVTLFVATQLVDIIWPVLVMFKIEKATITPGYTEVNPFNFIYYPYSHSLFMGIVWGIIAALVYALLKKDKRGAIVIGLCVLSHWFFDLIVHRADLPLSPFGNYKAGLGLWNNVAGTLIIESILFFGGLWIYTSITKAKNKIGKWGLWLLVAVLILVTISNTFGPVPGGVTITLLASSLALMLIVIFVAGWVDKNREIKN